MRSGCASCKLNPMNVHRILLTVLLVVCCAATSLAQTTKRELTIEWIFGPEGRSVASVPTTAWLDDGTLVLLDNRRPAAERTFERLNPATGQRQPLVDATRALADLKRAVDGINTLSWRSEEHTSELQSQSNLVCRLLLEKKKKKKKKLLIKKT